ncbi:MAG TPA: zinc-dependent alcohol dehydrogenase family protein [Thermoanaerobaculia bacterium]|nr:zinc-dependent alcohol dehydrogenase family protein [Thermoanaerobaculia bacterium]
MKTRAAVLHQTGHPLVVEELDLDRPGQDEVLVRIRAAGLCHSDLSVINGDRPRPVPMALGHEAAGEVLECGSGVRDLVPGDRVVMVFVPSCGGCVPCQEGRPALCEPAAAANTGGTLLCGERRLHLDGREVHHHLGVSAFSEYAVVSRRSVIKFDPSLSFEEAALFGCAVLTGVGAVVNTARVPAGTTVAVVGLGGVGLNALLGGILVGAREVIAVDLNEDKLSLAKSLGATATFNAGDPEALAKLREHTKGGVDFAFEMAGSVHAMDFAYRATRRGGTTITAGLSHPDHKWAVQHVNLVAEERTVKGSYIGSAVPLRDIPRYMALYQRGKLPVDRLMSDRMPLEDVNAGFDRLASGGAIRQILTL